MKREKNKIKKIKRKKNFPWFLLFKLLLLNQSLFRDATGWTRASWSTISSGESPDSPAWEAVDPPDSLVGGAADLSDSSSGEAAALSDFPVFPSDRWGGCWNAIDLSNYNIWVSVLCFE